MRTSLNSSGVLIGVLSEFEIIASTKNSRGLSNDEAGRVFNFANDLCSASGAVKCDSERRQNTIQVSADLRTRNFQQTPDVVEEFEWVKQLATQSGLPISKITCVYHTKDRVKTEEERGGGWIDLEISQGVTPIAERRTHFVPARAGFNSR